MDFSQQYYIYAVCIHSYLLVCGIHIHSTILSWPRLYEAKVPLPLKKEITQKKICCHAGECESMRIFVVQYKKN